MKLFVTSDTHNDEIILSRLRDFLKENTFDYVIHCGDIGGKDANGVGLVKFGQHQKTHVDNLLSGFSDILYLLGNDDWFESDDEHHLPNCTFKPREFVPFELVSITPFTTNREANENKIWYELNKLEVDSESIVIAHGPPHNCLDMTNRGIRVGSKAVTQYIEEKQPKLWLCGHIHEDYGVGRIGNTRVFNCACRPDRHLFRGWVINTDSLNFESVLSMGNLRRFR